jgi:hypothetical protein
MQRRHAIGQFGSLHRSALHEDGRQEPVLNPLNALFESLWTGRHLSAEQGDGDYGENYRGTGEGHLLYSLFVRK